MKFTVFVDSDCQEILSLVDSYASTAEPVVMHLSQRPETTTLINRNEFDVIDSPALTRKAIQGSPNAVITGDIFALAGTRAEHNDIWRLAEQGAAGVVVKNPSVQGLKFLAALAEKIRKTSE